MVKPPSRPEKIVHVLDGEDLHGSPYLSRSYGPLAQKLGRISAISSIVWVLTFHLSRSKSSRYLSRDIPAVASQPVCDAIVSSDATKKYTIVGHKARRYEK